MRLNSEEIGNKFYSGKSIKELAKEFNVIERRIEKCLYDYNYRRRIKSNRYEDFQSRQIYGLAGSLIYLYQN